MLIIKKLLAICLIFHFLALLGSAYCQDNYLLGLEDEIEVKVWDHDDLTRKIRVDLDGRISFPFAGEMRATGLTVLKLQKELERLLSKGYIVNPHVSITVINFNSQKFFVVGNVAKAGKYPLTKSIRVVEAISLAGGSSQGAVGKPGGATSAIIVRAQPGEKTDQPRMPDQTSKSQKITISIPAALAGDPNHNLEIKNGDTIFVPNLTFYITGQVKSSGRYPYEENMTVLMAVTTAGGFTDKASQRGTFIIRGLGSNQQKIKVKLKDLFKPDDTIVVPESFF